MCLYYKDISENFPSVLHNKRGLISSIIKIINLLRSNRVSVLFISTDKRWYKIEYMNMTDNSQAFRLPFYDASIINISMYLYTRISWKIRKSREKIKGDKFCKYNKRTVWRCPWCNGYRRRKWTRRHEFKSLTWLIAFHIALIPLGKVWIQLFSLQLWVNSRAD